MGRSNAGWRGWRGLERLIWWALCRPAYERLAATVAPEHARAMVRLAGIPGAFGPPRRPWASHA